MSTNVPMFGPVVLEKMCGIFINKLYIYLLQIESMKVQSNYEHNHDNDVQRNDNGKRRDCFIK